MVRLDLRVTQYLSSFSFAHSWTVFFILFCSQVEALWSSSSCSRLVISRASSWHSLTWACVPFLSPFAGEDPGLWRYIYRVALSWFPKSPVGRSLLWIVMRSVNQCLLKHCRVGRSICYSSWPILTCVISMPICDHWVLLWVGSYATGIVSVHAQNTSLGDGHRPSSLLQKRLSLTEQIVGEDREFWSSSLSSVAKLCPGGSGMKGMGKKWLRQKVR